jgi:hypothetical protein
MKRTIIWGLDNKANDEIVYRLHDNSLIDVRFWIRQLERTPRIKDLEWISYSDLFVRHKIPKVRPAPLSFRQKMRAHEHGFLMMNVRHQINVDVPAPIFTRSTEDDIDYYYTLVNYFYHLFTHFDIEFLISGNIYHEGADYTLYHVAKELGIPNQMFYQSIFPNRFFHIKTVDDMGDIRGTCKPLFPEMDFKLENYVKLKQHYMSKITDANDYLEEIEGRFMLKDILVADWSDKLMRSVFPDRFRIRDTHYHNGKYQRVPRLKALVENMEKYGNKAPDLDQEFIYFPLHLQPELTTSALGRRFEDQVFALQHLRSIIPSEVKIYAKENPKQWEAFRSHDFFYRLRQLPNVEYIHHSVSSFDLIDHCSCVATVTGTAGWEAVCQGVPTITFGNAWYNNLPGVFHFSPELSYKDVLSYTFDPTHFSNEVKDLSRYIAPGIMDRDYVSIYSDFDEEDNLNLITEAFKIILKDHT